MKPGALLSALPLAAAITAWGAPTQAASPARAATPTQAPTVTIEGRLLKGEERKPVAGTSVSLHIVKGNEELPGETRTTGPEGKFSFSGLRDDPELSYFLSTEFEGAFYTEGPVDVEGKGRATQDLVVYDVGRDIASVKVTNQHIIVERQPDHLHITEIVVLENSGRTAYLGTGMDHAQNAGIRLGLPASVKEFQPGMGGDAQTVRVQGRDLASLRPIPPGTRPFSFTYHIPLSGRMDLSHRLYFPTEKFVVLIEDPSLRLESPSLQHSGSRDQGGRKYEVYQGANFPVGSEVTMRIDGAGFWSNPRVYPWVAAPFAVIAVLIFAARKGRRARAHVAGAGDAARVAEAIPFAASPAPASHAHALAATGGGTEEGATVSGRADTGSGVGEGSGVGSMEGARAAAKGISSATQAAALAPSRAAIPPPPKENATGDDLATLYLYLIDALDRGLERGEFSRESHSLVRGNLKRRLEAILSDQPRTGTR